MSAPRESDPPRSVPPPPEKDPNAETLTDLIDRMDREAFRRALEQRDLKMLASAAERAHR
jgi:hypothetical protein